MSAAKTPVFFNPAEKDQLNRSIEELTAVTNKLCDDIARGNEKSKKNLVMLAEQWSKLNVPNQAKYLLMLAMVLLDDLESKQRCEKKIKAILAAPVSQQENEPNTLSRTTFYGLRDKADNLSPQQAMSLAWIYFIRFLHTPKDRFSHASDVLQEFIQAAVYMNKYFTTGFKKNLGTEFSERIEEQYLAAREAIKRLVENNKQQQQYLYGELEKLASLVCANVRTGEREIFTCTDWSAAQKSV